MTTSMITRSGQLDQRDPLKRNLSEPESQAHCSDLCLQKVLVERRKALTVNLSFDGEIVKDVSEGEQKLGALVHYRAT